VIGSLAGKTVEETAAIPSLHPRRAPVILAGSLIAEAVMRALGMDEAVVSEHDGLDGVATRLLAIP
jgi:exopolyphosphatase/guanosine-5'-triphosphate,3'-diphosphate pyrophosphatase